MDASYKGVADIQQRFHDAVTRLYGLPGADALRPVVEPIKASFDTSIDALIKANAKAEEIRIQVATYARAMAGSASLVVTINALVNDPGPPQWDAAVEVLLLKKFVGLNVPGFSEAATALTLKQPQNPFFEYAAHGPTDRMLGQILSKCPAPENDPPHPRFQWAWERTDDEKPPPWESTMYWDCLAVANFYKNGPVDARGLSAPDLSDPVKQASAAVANAGAAANSIVKSIDDLIKECQKLSGKCAVALLTAPLKKMQQEAEHALDQISKGQVPTPIAAPTIALPSVKGVPKVVPTPSMDPRPPVPGCPCSGRRFCPCR
ncbi:MULTISPECIES: hypothetical protein [Bradyrhizobium]|uniref:hypothetical protein n=1 Tax=Bradyrhizobium TaxID=374 RepID=UPI00155E6CC5|nr:MULTISPECIES: hypothetical protein [Bradyrhizobium]UUO32541.1 hypothetical protein DCG74_38560 [Bradyrhizobium sp. WBAH42]